MKTIILLILAVPLSAANITSGYLSRPTIEGATFQFTTGNWEVGGNFHYGNTSDYLHQTIPQELYFHGIWGAGSASGTLNGEPVGGGLNNLLRFPSSLFEFRGRLTPDGPLTMRGTFTMGGVMWLSALETCYICGEQVTGHGIATFTMLPFTGGYQSQWRFDFTTPEPSGFVLMGIGLLGVFMARCWRQCNSH